MGLKKKKRKKGGVRGGWGFKKKREVIGDKGKF